MYTMLTCVIFKVLGSSGTYYHLEVLKEGNVWKIIDFDQRGEAISYLL